MQITLFWRRPSISGLQSHLQPRKTDFGCCKRLMDYRVQKVLLPSRDCLSQRRQDVAFGGPVSILPAQLENAVVSVQALVHEISLHSRHESPASYKATILVEDVFDLELGL